MPLPIPLRYFRLKALFPKRSKSTTAANSSRRIWIAGPTRTRTYCTPSDRVTRRITLTFDHSTGTSGMNDSRLTGSCIWTMHGSKSKDGDRNITSSGREILIMPVQFRGYMQQSDFFKEEAACLTQARPDRCGVSHRLPHRR